LGRSCTFSRLDEIKSKRAMKIANRISAGTMVGAAAAIAARS